MNTLSKQDIRDARLGSEDQTLLSSIDEILDDMKLGKPVIIVDDEDREGSPRENQGHRRQADGALLEAASRNGEGEEAPDLRQGDHGTEH